MKVLCQVGVEKANDTQTIFKCKASVPCEEYFSLSLSVSLAFALFYSNDSGQQIRFKIAKDTRVSLNLFEYIFPNGYSNDSMKENKKDSSLLHVD